MLSMLCCFLSSWNLWGVIKGETTKTQININQFSCLHSDLQLSRLQRDNLRRLRARKRPITAAGAAAAVKLAALVHLNIQVFIFPRMPSKCWAWDRVSISHSVRQQSRKPKSCNLRPLISVAPSYWRRCTRYTIDTLHRIEIERPLYILDGLS